MKKLLLILSISLMLVGFASNSQAIEITNKSSFPVVATGTGNSGSHYYFRTIQPGGVTDPWLPSSMNVPATIYVCWEKICKHPTIDHAASIMADCQHGMVTVTGSYSKHGVPTLSFQSGCTSKK